MTKISEHKHHTITWVDLASSDIDAALEFYTDVLGNTLADANDAGYYTFMLDGAEVGGAMALSPKMAEGGMPPVWATYISVADVDATLATVVENGGTLFVPPFEIPGGGRVGVGIDPIGAVFGLVEGPPDMGFGVLDEPGAACWFETMTRDAEAAATFYKAVFGWVATPMPGPMPYFTFSLDGGDNIAGMMEMGEMFPPQVPSHWAVSFSVSDADAAVEIAVRRGARNVMPPTDTPYGRAAGLMDPWGSGFNVIDRSSATAG